MYPQKCPEKKNNNKKQLSWNESWLSQQIQPYCVYLKQHKGEVGGGHKEIPIHGCKIFIKSYETEKQPL